MPLRHRVVLGFVLIAPACLPCRADDPNRTAYWVGGSGEWDQPVHWEDANGEPLGRYPDKNILPEYEWHCIIDAGPGAVDVYLYQPHTVFSIDTNSLGGVDHDVDLVGLSPHVELTVENKLINHKSLDMHVSVVGQVENYGVLDLDDLDIDGDLVNHVGAEVGTGGAVEIEQDVRNHGALVVFPYVEICVGGDFVNDPEDPGDPKHSCAGHDPSGPDPVAVVDIRLGMLEADGGFHNDANAIIRGTGGLSVGSMNNEGMVRSARGDLSLYTEFDGETANTGTLTNDVGTSLHVDVPSIDHRGRIIVNAQGAVTFTCDLTNSPGASIELLGGTIAAPNVVNEPGASFTGFGGVTGDLTNNGLIELYGDSFIVGDVRNSEGAELKIRNGGLLVTGHTTNDGRIKVTNGDAYFEGGLTDNGRLEIDPALVVVVGDLAVGPDGVMTLDANSTLQLMRDFENRSTRRGDFDLWQGTVQFHGDGRQDFEAAGRDVGADPSGWAENFAIGKLIIEPDSLVRLTDLFDNQLDGGDGEAVYVDELVIETGGWIDLNGLNLYYLNGGDPKKLLYGDFDFSGDVGRSDFAILEAGFGTAAGAGWSDGDTDGDGDVDFRDYLVWKANVGPSSDAAPEPGTLALLALPAGAVLLRRRRR